MLLLSTLLSSPCCGDLGSTEPLNPFSATARCPLASFHSLRPLVSVSLTLEQLNLVGLDVLDFSPLLLIILLP